MCGISRALDRGDTAGLAGYFYAHPDLLPGALRTTQRADSQEFRGAGDATLHLTPSDAAAQGGRFTVVLVAARDAVLRWRATSATGDIPVPAAARTLRLTAGVPLSATVAYAGVVPARLSVDDPVGVPWGVLVDFTN